MNNTVTRGEIPLEELIFGPEVIDGQADPAAAKAASGMTAPGRKGQVALAPPDDPLLSRVAAIFAHGLWLAVQELEKSRAGRDQELLDTIGRQQKEIETADRVLAEMAARCDLLGNAQASLDEARVSHESAIESLQHGARDLDSSMAARIDELGARADAQDKELSALHAAVAPTSPRLDGLVERLNRQAAAIQL